MLEGKGKGKVVHLHAMKVCEGGLEVYFILGGVEWPASRPGRFTVGERTAPPSLRHGTNNHYLVSLHLHNIISQCG